MKTLETGRFPKNSLEGYFTDRLGKDLTVYVNDNGFMGVLECLTFDEAGFFDGIILSGSWVSRDVIMVVFEGNQDRQAVDMIE